MSGAWDKIREHVSALLGISAYQSPPPGEAFGLDSVEVERIRTAMGGQLSPIPQSQTRWYLSDLEMAELSADTGNLSLAARLMRAAKKDGILAGVLSTRTSGLVRLPKKFRGDPEIVAALEVGHEIESEDGETRSVFDEMCPSTELAAFAADAELLNVAVGELVPVEGRDYPVFVRHDPEFLQYRWVENRWYFKSVAGTLPITPGDGRWVLHTGGRVAPWQQGMWKAVGRAYIRKDHANLHKDNWEAKLANPARVAYAPQSASEEQSLAWFQAVLAWGVNSCFGMTPGYEVKLLESNGRGWESFNTTIEQQNNEFIICIAGQTVTTDGGSGFANADIHKSIRADLIKATADSLAHTINTQVIPAFVVARFGPERLNKSALVEWDVTPPKDRASDAQAMAATASAISSLTEALAPHGRKLDIDAMCSRFGIPISGDRNGDGKPETKTNLKLVDQTEAA
jgi:hypothetical protein